jgi:peptidoglycan lytic transglycosylase
VKGPVALRIGAVAAAALLAAGCAETQLAVHMTKRLESAAGESASATHGTYKIGDPYKVDGTLYRPHEDFFYDETGIASWYGPGFHGNRTANGDLYDQNALTAAHPTLQMPAKVQVTNLENGRSIAVIVNDRGPYLRGRIIDLSRRAAQLLGFADRGTARVRVRALPEESYKLAVLAGRKGPAPAILARARQEAPVQVATLPAAAPAPRPAAVKPATSPVTFAPVRPNAIYIQAGAFSQYANADRLRSRLAPVGHAAITPVEVGVHRLWRVRIGPLPSVEDADKALGRVVGLGYSEARLVVD